jgi:hypothetical protein
MFSLLVKIKIMELIDPYAPLATYKKIVAQYGGEYSFFENLKMGGIGSPKLKYVSGIPEFDAIHYSDDLEQSISNIELLKNGLILRINKKQKLAVAIAELQLLTSIQLQPQLREEGDSGQKAGILKLVFENQPTVVFEVGVEEYEGLQRFLGKRVLSGFL